MSFDSSTPKTDCKNENTRSKLWENNLFDFIIEYMLPQIIQDAFQSMENLWNNMKATVFFYF